MPVLNQAPGTGAATASPAASTDCLSGNGDGKPGDDGEPGNDGEPGDDGEPSSGGEPGCLHTAVPLRCQSLQTAGRDAHSLLWHEQSRRWLSSAPLSAPEP